MQTRIRNIGLLAALSAFGLVGRVAAGDACCDHCGCTQCCQKVCRLVCEEKKVDVICWGCKCEDFCVPKPSTPGCKHCKCVCVDCEACSKCQIHVEPKRFVWTEWCPGCAKIFTKKKLMKKVETVKIPSYKWVVECVCPQCEANCGAAVVAADTDVPAPPATDAKVIYPVRK